MFILLSGTIPPVNGEEESKFVVLLNMWISIEYSLNIIQDSPIVHLKKKNSFS